MGRAGGGFVHKAEKLNETDQKAGLLNLVTLVELKDKPSDPKIAEEQLQKVITSYIEAERRKIFMKICVSFMFVMIVLLVAYAHINHNLLERAKKLAATDEKPKKHDDVLKWGPGNLVSINKYNQLIALHGFLEEDEPSLERYNMCPKELTENGKTCVEWKEFTHVYFSLHKYPDATCYNIEWKTLNNTIDPEDCFNIPGYWYGGGQTPNMDWPMNIRKLAESSPFVTGDTNSHQWGSVLQRTFFNSKGISITIDKESPLHITRLVTPKRRLCLKAKYDSDVFIYRRSFLPVLNYNICVSRDIKASHAFVAKKNAKENALCNLIPSEYDTIKDMMTQPIFHIEASPEARVTDESVLNYTKDVLSTLLPHNGYLLFDEFWQAHPGDFEFDSDRFPNIQETLTFVRSHGFKVAVTIQPYVSIQSVNYKELVNLGLLVQLNNSTDFLVDDDENFEIDDKGFIAANTTYKSSVIAGMIDITNENAVKWIQSKLVECSYSSGDNVDAVYIDFGNAFNLPHKYRFKIPLINPDSYMNIFLKAASQRATVIGVSSAVVTPRPTTFVSLPRLNNTWESLRQVVPLILTYGITGFPFIMPNVIGGNPDIQSYNMESGSDSQDTSTDDDNDEDVFHGCFGECQLQLRWLQLAAFLPVTEYLRLPMYFKNKYLQTVAFHSWTVRIRLLNRLFEKYAREAVQTGLPIIRPLWMLDPNDKDCLIVNDHFAIGDEIVVVPILKPNATETDVYLPHGTWKNGLNDDILKGGRWYRGFGNFNTLIPFFIREIRQPRK